MNGEELAYVAGFFDGEGCIFVSKGTKNQYFLCVSITNTNQPIMESIKKIMNLGEVSMSHDKRKRSSALFRIQFYCNEAKAFLEKIHPYLK